MENLAFIKASSGQGYADFAQAAEMAKSLGISYKHTIYAALAKKNSIQSPIVETQIIEHKLHVPAHPKTLVLGKSKIIVTDQSLIGSQVERVNRDWLSNNTGSFPTSLPAIEEIIPYHEGARIRDILRGVNAKAQPLSGTLLQEDKGRWYAPDADGKFKHRKF